MFIYRHIMQQQICSLTIENRILFHLRSLGWYDHQNTRPIVSKLLQFLDRVLINIITSGSSKNLNFLHLNCQVFFHRLYIFLYIKYYVIWWRPKPKLFASSLLDQFCILKVQSHINYSQQIFCTS